MVQTAMKLVLEPIFEADFHNCSYGYRHSEMRRRPARPYARTCTSEPGAWWRLIFAAITTIPHAKLMILIKQRVVGGSMLRLIKQSLTVGVAYQGKVEPTKVGVPQG